MSTDSSEGEALALEPAEGAFEAPAPHPRRMLGRYEVIAEIARGGMGTVLLARLEGAGGFERLMAIKLMHEHLAADRAFVEMLLDEARTAANIQHPNAVGIVDVTQGELGYYLVMSYVEGFTLADLLAHPKLEARDRIRFGVRLLVDACQGLHAAHTTRDARGKPLDIVHRDVSPQNVLVGLDGVARIVDFGIALAASRVTSSRPGMLKGKPSYMAPEQVRSEPCDARADVFALGIVLWEILVGRQLFQSEMDVATLLMVVQGEIPEPKTLQPLVTDGVNAVVMKALERELRHRTHDARTLGAELEAAASAGGLIASSHEVSDALERLFAHEIESKQAAIRRHLAASKGEKKPLGPGQLHLVPRLYEHDAARSLPLGEEIESGVREVDGHAATRHSGVSVERTRVLPPVPDGGDASDATPAAEPSEPAPIDASSRSSLAGRIGMALGAIGIVSLLAAGAWIATRGDEPPRDPAPPATEAPLADDPPDAPVVAAPDAVAAPREPAVATPREPGLAGGDARGPVEAPTDEAPPASAEIPSSEPRSAEVGPAAPRPVEAPRGARPRRTPAPTEAPAPSTTVETNPYLTR